MTQAPLYRIHVWCPRCDKEREVVAPIMPNPRVKCGECLMDRTEVVEMKIVAAEQLEPVKGRLTCGL